MQNHLREVHDDVSVNRKSLPKHDGKISGSASNLDDTQRCFWMAHDVSKKRRDVEQFRGIEAK